MKRTIQTYSTWTMLTMALLWMTTACSRDSVDELRFQVTTEGNVSLIKCNESVTFLFEGDPDYITFFAGDAGNNYANRYRTEAELSQLTMECSVRQQYNDTHYLGQELLHIYLSTDFSGTYSAEAIHQATWIPISGREYGRLPVPIPTSAAAVETNGSTDLSRYIDINKPFYVAFLYNAAGREEVPTANSGGHYITRPRIDVSNLNLHKLTADGERLSVTNASTEWGFRMVTESSATQTNYQTTDNGLLFQPQKATIDEATGREPDEVVWMVSQQINPCSVSPDCGTPIKTIEAYLRSYSYTYKEPGTYTATFVATNANLWDSQQQTIQLTIQVNEP